MPLGEADYADLHTSYHAFLYVTTWDGPITPQPEEVAYGAWLSAERLLDRMADPEIEFMPDTVTLLGGWLRDHVADVVEPEQGWDAMTTVVEGRWLDRRPRYPDYEVQLRTETRLMPRLAPLLPLPVPVPVVLDEEPLRVRHVMIPGSPAPDEALDAEQGRRLGEFLRCLHDLPVNIYVEAGVPDAWRPAPLPRPGALPAPGADPAARRRPARECLRAPPLRRATHPHHARARRRGSAARALRGRPHHRRHRLVGRP